ncbi:MAG TPA: hypothetical protein VKU80_04210 [Planctomycetota bacterium]|nr:hypothetical protein [Planctomycetota bacterium]
MSTPCSRRSPRSTSGDALRSGAPAAGRPKRRNPVLLIAAGAAGLFLAANPAWAQQDFSRWEDLFSDHPSEYRARARVTSYAEEGVKDQTADFSMIDEEVSASGLVWQDDHDDVRLSAGVQHENIRTGAILPDTGSTFPDELWNVNIGATYRYLFESGVVLGGTVGVGSASDRPFHSRHEIVESVMLFVKLPVAERDAWLLGLAYSNNRDYANSYPVPLVEYFYNPSWDFHAMVGFPMEFLEWHPARDLTLLLIYSLIHNIHALASYHAADPLRLYIGFDWNTERYLLADRPETDDRFFYDEKRAKGGVRLELGEGWSLDLSGGYAFGRKYAESSHGFRSAFDRVDIGSGAYGLLSVEWRLGHARKEYDGKSAQDK